MTGMVSENELSATELLGWAMLLMMWPRDAALPHERLTAATMKHFANKH